LSVALGPGGNSLGITGTAANTSTAVATGSGTDTVTVSGSSGPLAINTAAGSGTVNILAVGGQSSVNTGTGPVVVNVGSTALKSGGTLAGLAAPLTVTAGSGGATTLNLDDSGDTTSASGTLTPSGATGLNVTGLNTQGITASRLSAFNLALGQGTGLFTVAGTTVATTTTIDAGGGPVAVQAIAGPTSVVASSTATPISVGSNAPGGGGNLAGIQAALTVNGGALTVDDTGNSNLATGTLTASALTGLDLGTGSKILPVGVTSLAIGLGNGVDTFTIASTAAGTSTKVNTGTGADAVNVQAVSGPTSVNTGSGNDSVNVGSNAAGTGGKLNPIAAALTVTGGGGTDTLNLDDTGDAAGPSGTVAPTMVTGFGMATGVTYSGFATLNLNLGTGANSVMVTGTGVNPPTVTSISGGGTIKLSTPGDFTGTVNAAGFSSASVNVPGKFSGAFNLSGPITVTNVSITSSFTGQLVTGGTIQTVTLGGPMANGLISAGVSVGTISATGVSGPAPFLRVVEGSVLRQIEVTPSGSSPAYPTLEYYYQSTAAGVSTPQVAIRVTSPGSGPFDMELAAYNAGASGVPISHSTSAKFDLTWLDTSTGATGLHDLGIEGDLLTTPTAQALTFFGPGSAGTGGIKLPSDALGSVAARDEIADVSISAKSVQELAFGQYAGGKGQVVAASTATSKDAAGMLTSTTAVAAASGTLRAPFGSVNAVAVFLGTTSNGLSSSNILLTDEVAQDPNAPSSGTAILAVLTVTAGSTPTVSVLAFSGDGGSVSTALPVTSITSTGDLGDLTLSASSAVTNVTAPSVFGNVSLGGNLTGIFQTTGQRIDPITGVSTSVPADLGQLYISSGVQKATTFSVKSSVTAPGGAIISRGNLVSAVSIGGTMAGVIAAQGNLGAQSGTSRFGGVSLSGSLTGQVVALGNIIGDITVSGGMKSGRIAADGAIQGNITVNNGLDANSVIVARGAIGGYNGTVVTLSGTIAGFVASEGAVTLSSKTKLTLGSTLFNSQNAAPGTTNATQIDDVFEDGGVPISHFDKTTPGDLKELTTVLLPQLLKLRVSGGALTDS
jgi:hypothetical protein